MKRMTDVVNVAENIKTIENLKVELLRCVASLFADAVEEPDNDTREKTARDAAGVIAAAYLLGQRLGVSDMAMDENIDKAKGGLRTGAFDPKTIGGI